MTIIGQNIMRTVVSYLNFSLSTQSIAPESKAALHQKIKKYCALAFVGLNQIWTACKTVMFIVHYYFVYCKKNIFSTLKCCLYLWD